MRFNEFKPLTEAASDDELARMGWTENAGIGLWMRPDCGRWIVDTNAERIISVYDEYAGYGEGKMFGNISDVMKYIDEQEKISIDGKVFYYADNEYGHYLKIPKTYWTGSGWSEDWNDVKLMQQKEAENEDIIIIKNNPPPSSKTSETYSLEYSDIRHNI